MAPTPAAAHADRTSFASRAARILGARAARLVLSGVMLAGAALLIWRQLSGVSPGAFLGALAATTPLALAASLLLTGCSYACLSITEWLSARALGHRLTVPQAARVAVPAYALTNSAGFSPVTGTAVRVQLYAPRGIDAKGAAAISLLAGAAVTLSGCVVLGLCFVIDPHTAARAVHGRAWAPLAAAGLLIAPAGLWFIAFARAAPRWLGGASGRELGRGVRLAGLMAGLGDWLFSGLALFVLLQTPQAGDLPAFLAAFVAGSLVSAATGVPGGLGVFEAIVLVLTPVVSQAHETAAALLIYRVVYSLAPLGLVTAGGLIRRWRHARRAPPGDSAQRNSR
jgi:phosphatidylglycerol lysyltransferase